MAAGSPPTATSIKGSATPSFISTFLPTRWHSLSERRSRRLIATPAPSGALFGGPDENYSLCRLPRWRLAVRRGRSRDRQRFDRRMGQYFSPLRGIAGPEHDGDGNARRLVSGLAPGLPAPAS